MKELLLEASSALMVVSEKLTQAADEFKDVNDMGTEEKEALVNSFLELSLKKFRDDFDRRLALVEDEHVAMRSDIDSHEDRLDEHGDKLDEVDTEDINKAVEVLQGLDTDTLSDRRLGDLLDASEDLPELIEFLRVLRDHFAPPKKVLKSVPSL
jgi:ATP-dependent Clp protease ATP-binding subunit ClpA